MKESFLIKICLISIFLGIIIMFLSSRIGTPKDVKISNISEKDNYVKISGKIVEISKSKSGTAFLKVRDESGVIDVIIFENSIKNLEYIKSGQKVEIIGKPQKYKEKMEIIAASIQIQ